MTALRIAYSVIAVVVMAVLLVAWVVAVSIAVLVLGEDALS